MKRSISIVVMLSLALGAWASPKFGNVITSNTVDVLPSPLDTKTGRVFSPTLRQYQQAGWRYATVTNVPTQTNLIALSYVPQDIDGTNCQLLVATTYDWVARNAMMESNRLAAMKTAVTNFQMNSYQTYLMIVGSQTNMPAAYRWGKGQALICASNIIYEGHP